MSSLSQGARGDAVKALQQQLIDNGYMGKSLNTGFYGPITAAAVKKFQTEKGISPDGVATPTTSAALTSKAGADFLDSHPEFSPELKQYLGNMKSSNPDQYYRIAQSVQTGLPVNAGMFYNSNKAAEDAVTPYYQQDATNSRGALQNYLDTTTGQYNQDTNTLQNNATNDFDTQNDTEGQKGTWGSSARASRMKSLENTYNDKFNTLYNNNRSDIYNKLQSQEYNYGAGETPTVNLTKTNVDLGTNTPSFGSTSSSVYNPFNFAGRKNAEKAATITDLTNKGVASNFYPLNTNTTY